MFKITKRDKHIKNILKIIFITLGVIFTIIIVAVAIFIIVDPFNLRPLLFNSQPDFKTNTETTGEVNAPENKSSDNTIKTQTNDKHPLLNEKQEKQLETIGIEVENLPTQITPEMEKCFLDTLGAERVKEITDGATPGPVDLFKARECLEKIEKQ